MVYPLPLGAELRPCPVCSSTDVFLSCRDIPIVGTVYTVICRRCGSFSRSFDISSDAVDFWNSRTDIAVCNKPCFVHYKSFSCSDCLLEHTSDCPNFQNFQK